MLTRAHTHMFACARKNAPPQAHLLTREHACMNATRAHALAHALAHTHTSRGTHGGTLAHAHERMRSAHATFATIKAPQNATISLIVARVANATFYYPWREAPHDAVTIGNGLHLRSVFGPIFQHLCDTATSSHPALLGPADGSQPGSGSRASASPHS